MTSSNLKSRCLIGILGLLSLLPSSIEASTFDRIVVFGGSTSDSGNAFALLNFAHRPPYDQFDLDQSLIPSGPYSLGGNHFTNGATWIEQFGRGTGLGGSVRPAFASSNPHATNYAVGAARATDDGINLNLPQQVAAFLNDFNNVAPAEALYVIDFGGNDVRDALVGDDPQAVLENALASIAEHIQLLYASGARNILVLNVADIGALPAVGILDNSFPGAALAATFLTVVFNSQLDNILAFLGALPDIKITLLDLFQNVNQMIANPSTFGLTQVEQVCITPNVPPFSCKNPDQFLFWDGVHATKAVHAFFAVQAANVLGTELRDVRPAR
jgi:phospholipase/lecithinase/hemolysin